MSVIDLTDRATLSGPAVPGPPVPRRFRPDIQGIRAVAVLLVVLYHAGTPLIRGGYVGVDVFFVISGYLITQQLTNEVEKTGRVSLLRFYGRRIRRLLPPAALVAVVTVLAARILLPVGQVSTLVRDAWFSAIYAINYCFAVEGVNYQNATAPPSALQHYWSLAVEEQFYVFWPLLILACALIAGRRGRRPLMVLAISVICAVTLWFSLTVTAVNTPMAYFSLHTRAWELGLGALVALTATTWARLPGRWAALASWAGLAAVLTSALVYSDTTLYPGAAATVPVVGTALIIASGAHRQTWSAETVLLERRPMQLMGKYSYSWYLWHWPMLVLLPALAGHPLGLWSRLEVVGLALWLAVLTYFLESASRRSSWTYRQWLPTGLSLSAGTVVAALVVSVSLPTLVGNGIERQVRRLDTADVSTVQAALADAMHISALPRNLTPGLGKAPQDEPQTNGEGCHASLLETRVLACTYGDLSAQRTAVLLGDSHAQQWLGPLSLDAKAKGWKVVTYTKAACPVAQLTVWNDDLKRTYNECDAWRKAAFAKVRASKPELIIASQSDAVPWSSVTDKEWAERTRASLQSLAGTASRVLYIGDTPQTKADPVSCLEQHLDDAKACAYPRAAAYPYFPERRAVLRSALNEAGFQTLDPMNFFCGTSCPAVVGNMVVRRDQGHITNTYATWLAPVLMPIFEDTQL
jgi:peptidoglycan/LPS O-acetylase OafA/YrhL